MGQVLFCPAAGICQRPLGIVLSVFLSLSFSLPCKSFTHHHPPRYLEVYLKVMFKVRVHHRDIDFTKLGSGSQVRFI